MTTSRIGLYLPLCKILLRFDYGIFAPITYAQLLTRCLFGYYSMMKQVLTNVYSQGRCADFDAQYMQRRQLAQKYFL